MSKKDGKILTKNGVAKINIYTGDVNFRASNEGDPSTQKKVKKIGNSTFYETEGEKKRHYVAQLKVPADCADPYTELTEQLEKLIEPLMKLPFAPTTKRDRCLLDHPHVKVFVRKSENVCRVEMNLELSKVNGNMTTQLLNLTSIVNKCFATNRTSLQPQKK